MSDIRPHGRVVHDVIDYGAVPDPTIDSTTAFQRAIDGLPDTGGTVTVPAGRFQIDPRRSIKLRSSVRLQMDPATVLELLPNALQRYVGILVPDTASDVSIVGGQIVGDRLNHKYAEAGTHEWGHGIAVYGGRRVTILGTRISWCTGDGISLGHNCEDVRIKDVLCERNRRQGLTIGRSRNVEVLDSVFRWTGNAPANEGTAPKAGIDIEPDAGKDTGAFDVTIRRCRMTDNDGPGLLTMVRTKDVPPDQVPAIRNVRVEDCAIERNSNGADISRCTRLRLARCRIAENRNSGVRFALDSTAYLTDNVFANNYTKNGPLQRTPFEKMGWAKDLERDIFFLSTTGQLDIGLNYYE